MRKLDFISVSPQLSIFKEGANKTNLGGSLFLIYIIILILLSVIYFYDYFSNDKYEFTYTYVNTPYGKSIVEEEKEMEEFLNINLDSFFLLSKDNINGIISNKNFILFDTMKIDNKKRDIDGFAFINETEDIIKQGSSYKFNINRAQLAVLYRCHGSDGLNCNIRDEDKLQLDSYYLFFAYKGFNIDHQNSEKPIQKLPDADYRGEYLQFLENSNIASLNWELIKYKEDKGIFGKYFDKMMGKKDTYYGVSLKSVDYFTPDEHIREMPSKTWKIKDLDGNHFLLLFYLDSSSNYSGYEKYVRKKISFLDVLANIFALSSTVLNLMSLVYIFLYSQNYDNYKIVENILTKKMNININNKIKNKEEPKIELKDDLLINDSDENENNDIDKNIGEENKKPNSSIDMPTPKFFDFLVHQLYFKCFGSSSKQSLIDSCNDIVCKYITIESIIYNQIKLDYLWKDYKWNNPQYDINQKDDLILKLKEK